MNSNVLNIIGAGIIVAVAGAGGIALLQPKKPATAAATQWHECYQEDVKGPVPNYVEDENGVPKGWHRQIVAVLSSRRQSPQDLPPDIMAMPDLSGEFKLPNLRVALAAEREEGKTALADAVRKFHDETFDALFAPDGKSLDNMRDILFRWAGVEGVAPDSRGPFIDARELAFLEKLFGDPFYQLGRFPKPLPVASAYLKDTFALLRKHYFAQLATQGAAGELLDFSGHHLVLNRTAWRKLADRAASLLRPEDKLHYWQQTLGAIPYDPLRELLAEDRRFLDALIRENTPELNLQNVLTSLEPDLAKGPSYYDRLGRRVIFKIIYSNKMNSRLTCYLYPDK